MKQRTNPDGSMPASSTALPPTGPGTSRSRRWIGDLLERVARSPRPLTPDRRLAGELEVIVARRLAQPPPAGSVRPLIRVATAQDRAALEEMALRCSAETLRRRFHAPAEHLPVRRVAELLHLPEGTIPAEILVLGYPEKTRKPTGKKSLDEVVFDNTFE